LSEVLLNEFIDEEGRIVQNNTRAILEGAFMSAIFLVLFWVAFYTPLGIITTVALSVPFMVYGYRHPARMGVLVVFVAVFLSFIFANISGVLVSLPSAVTGLVMGIAYRRKKEAGQVIVLGMIAQLVLSLAGIGLTMAIIQTNPIDDMIKGMQEVTNQTISEMQRQIDQSIHQIPADQQNGPQAKQLAQMKESMEQVKTQMSGLLPMVIPAFFIIFSLFSALLNHALFRLILRRMGAQIQALPALHNLRFPRSILYYYLIVLFLSMMQGLQEYHFLHMVVLNLMFIMPLLFFIQGLGFIAHIIRRRGLSRGLLVVAVILFLIPPFSYILLLIGILDVGFSLRNRFFRQ
jgi:uncharacterized protein YybS (DUF2232 family)